MYIKRKFLKFVFIAIINVIEEAVLSLIDKIKHLQETGYPEHRIKPNKHKYLIRNLFI